MESIESRARTFTTGLIDFLVEITEAAERDPIRDILSIDASDRLSVLWLEDLPTGLVAPRTGDDALLRLASPTRAPEPKPPAILAGWLDVEGGWGLDGPEPQLVEAGPVTPPVPGNAGDPLALTRTARPGASGPAMVDEVPGPGSAPPRRVVQEYEAWRRIWRAWAEERRQADGLRPYYELLEEAAKQLEQRDDEYELVFATGLVRWVAPDGRVIRRHLVSEQMTAIIDRKTAEVVVTPTGTARRLEDRQLFDGLECYHSDRAPDARDEALAGNREAPDGAYVRCLGEWLAACVATDVMWAAQGSQREAPRPTLELALAPALVLRPRSKVMLAEAYKQIAKQLRQPDTPLPVALAQLVLDTEPEQRREWILAQGGASGDFLGDDPRFPLDANDQQARVMDLLRTETGVVVQGPPGTGKTHTIANLVSALLARGQRVLVTSQKDQALRVLRDKIPAELRHLCVLLAGGSKNAATELQQGLDALSEAIATSDTVVLRDRVALLANTRFQLQSRAAALNDEIRQLRELESIQHEAIVPGYSTTAYTGTLSEIVREVKRDAERHDWMPPVPDDAADTPPLALPDLVDLRRLLITDSPRRRARQQQWVPRPTQVPPLATFIDLIACERTTVPDDHDDSALSQQVAQFTESELADLERTRLEATRLLAELGFAHDGTVRTAPPWAERAVNDHLAGRSTGLWGTLSGIREEPGRLLHQLQARGVSYVVDVDPVASADLGTARGALEAGKALAQYLRDGGKVRKRFANPAQRQAATFLSIVRVNGRAPDTLEHVVAGVERLEAEVATMQLVAAWVDCGVEVPTGRLPATLSDLVDKSRTLETIHRLVGLHARLTTILLPVGLITPVPNTTALMQVLDQVPGAVRRHQYEQARAAVEAMYRTVQDAAGQAAACPELGKLLTAIRQRDAGGYEQALQELDRAAAEQADAVKLNELSTLLAQAHPRLFELVRQAPSDPVWDQRLPELPAAWAWSKTRGFVHRERTAERERLLSDEYAGVEGEIKRVTEQLAGAEAMLECVNRMTDQHARALRAYREHMAKVGAGAGVRSKIFQAAARAAMEKAKGAVPAWVVPLPNLLDNLTLERNSFDVVIVDEASQVGMEHLFLLWLAPRVIVVGDDKQCTPGEARMGRQDRIFANLGRYLDGVDEEIRLNFTSKSNLYGMLSARSGKNAVVRLREHFRCVPEIITWSSTQFYSAGGLPGLVPLRERTATDLDPLQVRHVQGAFTEGRNAALRNPVEAKAIAEELAQRVRDPRYAKKTFGVVVLQGRGQVKLLELEINARLTPEERIDHQIRVGVPSDFQGDERDVIFLSMVVADPPRAQRAPIFQQAYNVAASRAKDQMWLFLSVRDTDLKPDDLRASLLGYMRNPPSTYGPSPSLSQVSETEPCQPFESLFEQRVFREIRSRGYHVVPQYQVGTRKLDLVVAGEGSRLAIECDGHRWHTTAEQTASDARRDRDLRRMRWDVVRVRESEFEFDRDRELTRVWAALQARRIQPTALDQEAEQETDGWAPVDLTDTDDKEPGEP